MAADISDFEEKAEEYSRRAAIQRLQEDRMILFDEGLDFVYDNDGWVDLASVLTYARTVLEYAGETIGATSVQRLLEKDEDGEFSDACMDAIVILSAIIFLTAELFSEDYREPSSLKVLTRIAIDDPDFLDTVLQPECSRCGGGEFLRLCRLYQSHRQDGNRKYLLHIISDALDAVFPDEDS